MTMVRAGEYRVHPYILIGALAFGLLLYLLFPSKERRAAKRIRRLSDNALQLTPMEFFELREEKAAVSFKGNELCRGVYPV